MLCTTYCWPRNFTTYLKLCESIVLPVNSNNQLASKAFSLLLRALFNAQSAVLFKSPFEITYHSSLSESNPSPNVLLLVISFEMLVISVVSSTLRIVAINSLAFHPSCIAALKLNGPVAVVNPLCNLPSLATPVILAHAYFEASAGSTNLIKLFSVNIANIFVPLSLYALSNTSTAPVPDETVSWK